MTQSSPFKYYSEKIKKKTCLPFEVWNTNFFLKQDSYKGIVPVQIIVLNIEKRWVKIFGINDLWHKKSLFLFSDIEMNKSECWPCGLFESVELGQVWQNMAGVIPPRFQWGMLYWWLWIELPVTTLFKGIN